MRIKNRKQVSSLQEQISRLSAIVKEEKLNNTKKDVRINELKNNIHELTVNAVKDKEKKIYKTQYENLFKFVESLKKKKKDEKQRLQQEGTKTFNLGCSSHDGGTL